MKKRILATFLFGICIFTMVGCSFKVKPNINIQDIEGSGNLIISSNLMNALNSLGKDYEFVPLEYENGVSRGIISPTKIEDYILEVRGQIRGLNPLRYMEYTLNAIEVNSFLQETGNILGLNEIFPYVLDVSNPKNIILKDNERKIEKTYTSKVAEEFIVAESIGYNGSDGSEIKFNDFRNKDGETIHVQYSTSETIGKDNRYVYSSFGYTDEIDENGQGKDYRNILVLYDSKTEKIYESEIRKSEDYNSYVDTIFEVNNEIYFFNYNGKIDKVVLENGKILFEEYYDLELSENQVLMISYAYTNNSTEGDNIFINIGKRSSGSGTTYMDECVFNIKNKNMINLPRGEEYINIHKIFSNSDNLVMVSKRSNISNKIWIAKYEDGKFENLVQIDKIHPNNASIYTQNIQDILYDGETNSFFIKRRAKIGYQYEVLKLE